MSKAGDSEVLQVDGCEVTITNPGKVLFPEAGHTKLDLARYYLAVADGALRGAGGRPNVLVRYPNGITGEFFYQKRAPASRPAWIDVVALQFPSGRTAEEIVPRNAAALAWMANLACLELHPHPVRADDLDHPDELRIDLDPVPGVTWAQMREVARRRARDADRPRASPAGRRHPARAASTSSSASSGGGRSRRSAAPRSRSHARSSGARPAVATSKWWKEERHGVFLDYNQNAKDRTVASRLLGAAEPDARVSAPVTWQEIEDCDPADFTLDDDAGAVRDGRRSSRRDRRSGPLARLAARALGAAREGRTRRRAVAAAVQEAGRGAAPRPAVAAPACRSTR